MNPPSLNPDSPVTFGDDGFVSFKLSKSGVPGDNDGKAVEVQADGKILVAGYARVVGREDFGIIRLNTDGSLDTTFSEDGRWSYTPEIDKYDTLLDIATQPDGKILGVGLANDTNDDAHIAVLRLNSDGSLDTTFDSDGISYLNLPGALFSEGKRLHLLANGKILVAGEAYITSYRQMFVARYNSNGSLDTTFNSGSGFNILTIAGRNNEVEDLKTDNLGRIVVGGATWPSGDLSGVIARLDADGNLDTTFGGTGIVITNRSSSASDSIHRVHPLIDGSVLVSGYLTTAGNSNCYLSKYTDTGLVDNTFNGTGISVVDFGGSDVCRGMNVQSDNSILLSGNSASNFVVAKLNSAGSLDASYGSSGLASVDITGNTDYDYSADSALLSDGRLLIAGYTYVDDEDYSLARFNSNGTLDTTFNGTGTGRYDIDGAPYDAIHSISLQSDGKVLLGGAAESNDWGKAAFARLKPDGTPDSSFGSDGTTLTYPQIWEFASFRKTHFLADGKILAAGDVNGNFLLARFNANGSLDTTFASGAGFVLTSFAAGTTEAVYSMLVQLDGKITLIGTYNNNIALAQYNEDGSLDAGFGTGGTVLLDLGSTDVAYDGRLLDDGKLLISGKTQSLFMLLKLNADGSLDTTWGSGTGYLTTNLGAASHTRVKMELLKDGHIILAGQADSHFGVAKYNPDGSLDTSFGTAGSTIVSVAGSTAEVFRTLGVQSDGRILLAGNALQGSPTRALVLRLNTDGSLDTSFGTSGLVFEQPFADDRNSEFTALAINADDSFYAAGLHFKNRYNSIVYKYGKNGVR
ncbi:delta-60 repeat domain-containing protein [Bdellovibrio bacteriovorus]|uniref:delta-60 repeat domain-containing protein n=1 Tax=Bdellovibrio bacteriovorus TaxID=959 RepID=UPI003CFE09A1